MPIKQLVVGGGTGLVVLAALYGFVAVRASADPAFNWGGADSAARLVDLVTMEDFGFGADTFSFGAADDGRGAGGQPSGGGAGGGAEARRGGDGGKELTPGGAIADLVGSVPVYAAMASREAGVVTLLLAVAGAVALWWRAPRNALLPVVGVLVTSAAGAAVVVLPGRVRGFQTTLVQGGFLLGVWIPLAVLAALGATAVIDVMRRRRARSEPPASERLDRVGVALAVVVAAAVLVPSLVVHERYASHDVPAFADAYTENVFASLPDEAVLIVWGAERAFPLWYGQHVRGLRPDVDVVAADGLPRDWYREQVEDRLGVDLPDDQARALGATEAAAEVLAQTRPVYLDTLASQLLGERVAYEPHGLVAELVDVERSGPVRPSSLREVEALFAGYDVEGVYTHPRRREFPYGRVLQSYAVAHAELARWYVLDENWDRAEHHLGRALSLEPGSHRLRQQFRFVSSRR